MRKRGRPPVMKAWRVRIHNNGKRRDIIIKAKTREEAEEMARFIVKQSFPFSNFSVRRFYGKVRV
ncbi:hypothetical protein APY94_02900 [Thermococcus celericrescens]|uniref:50S ribosomal protein L16 n=1 Tax=Thermococcus celericrescens TaxID=227598 RepID=A0A100XZ51_9EURY|nr:hypothetical protein [Thermococcus celericrescens]KUH34238.1 hypothetical protein APY94_02900 [Thermococcus celericrescens]